MLNKFKKIKVLAKDIKPGDKLRSFNGYDLVLAVDKKGDQVAITRRSHMSSFAFKHVPNRHLVTFTVHEALKLCILQEEIEELDAALEAL